MSKSSHTPGPRAAVLALAVAMAAVLAAPRGVHAAEGAPRPAAPVRELLAEPGALVSWIVGRSPELGAAAARVTQAGADVGTARLVPNPTLDLGLADLPLGTTNPPGLGFSDTTIYTIGLSETIEIGKRGPRIASARLKLQAAEKAFADVVVQKTAEARLALARVVYLKAKLGVLQESLASANQALALERTRMEQGQTSGNDYDRLALETLSLGIDVERSRSEHEAALAACRAVLLAECDAGAAGDADLDGAAPVPAEADDLEAALRQRPDVRVFELTRDSALEDARLARRRVLPDPTLRVGFTYDRLVVSGDQPKTLMFTLSVPLPIFDHGQHDARRALGRAQEAGLSAAGALERARADVAAARRRAAFTARAVRLLAGEAVPKSRAVLETTSAAVGRGQVGMTDLLLARRTHIALLVNLMDVRFDSLQARNELRRVLGLDRQYLRGALQGQGKGAP
ncbi:MAG TPA: TolC family protein [Polyangia bacterium]